MSNRPDKYEDAGRWQEQEYQHRNEYRRLVPTEPNIRAMHKMLNQDKFAYIRTHYEASHGESSVEGMITALTFDTSTSLRHAMFKPKAGMQRHPHCVNARLIFIEEGTIIEQEHMETAAWNDLMFEWGSKGLEYRKYGVELPKTHRVFMLEPHKHRSRLLR